MKIKNVAKIFIFSLSILILFIFSEYLYLRNNSHVFTNFFFETSRIFAKRGNIGWSTKILSYGAELIINYNRKKYPEVIPKNFSVNVTLPENNLKKYLIDSNDYQNLLSQSKYSYSRIFYDFALISFKNRDEGQYKDLMEISYYLNPELSYSAVELANYYRLKGNIDSALKVLIACQKISAPSVHCRRYQEYFENKNPSLNPGFLMKEVEEFYKYPSTLSL